MQTHRVSLLAYAIMMVLLSSCANMKEALYFNGVGNDTFRSDSAFADPLIQVNDVLAISITSLNAEASQAFNPPPGAVQQTPGILVDAQGNIQLPFLGNIKAAGLSKTELKKQITRKLVDAKLLMEPIVNIRFLNHRVTILGEVGRPGIISIPGEKITFLEAIGNAGDITLTGNRKNVLLIRETDGVRQTQRIDLTDPDFFMSNYYTLRPNDVIYVEPNRTRVAGSARINVVLPVVLSVVTLGMLVLDRVTQ